MSKPSAEDHSRLLRDYADATEQFRATNEVLTALGRSTSDLPAELHPRDWYADHAVPSVANASRSVATSSSRRWDRLASCAASGIGDSMRRVQDGACMCDDRRMTAHPDVATVAPSDLDAERSLGESRWPPALALVLFMAINVALRVWLPHETAVGIPWAVPAIEAVLPGGMVGAWSGIGNSAMPLAAS